MTERVSSVEAYARRIYNILDGPAMARVERAAGFAGKDAALEAAAQTLGPDRAMSNFKSGQVKLTAGFDIRPGTSEVVIGHGPKGLWLLADRGRDGSGAIYPRRNGRKARSTTAGRAVMTPYGPRASSSYSSSRGVGSLRRAAAKERVAIPKAAFRQIQSEIGRALR